MSLPAIIALVGVGAFGLIVAWMLWRTRGTWPAIPDWTWSDIRKLIALVATVAGAAILTVLAWWVLDHMAAVISIALTKQSDILSQVAVIYADGTVWGVKLLLAGVLLVILSLGLVIGPRLFKFGGPGNTSAELGGGEPEIAAAAKVAAAAERAKDEVVDEVRQ